MLIVGAVLAGCSVGPPPLVPSVSVPVTAPAPAPAREVVVGVDRISGGFNPHTLADLTPVSAAVAGVVLPSAFRQSSDGTWVRDTTLLTSAQVTRTDPFTVTYRIRHNAQWSDTAPIAAEDFGYLAEQMRTQPGVVDSAGYQLIDEVISRDGGKTAEVVFSRPYPGWRTLFRHLLPAHLLKDAPGGWSQALARGLLVSGGPFTLLSVDTARGELVLVRNDRYWDTPAEVDRIVLRQGSDGALVDALGNGGAQAALFGHPNVITEALLREAGLSATVLPQPILTSVLLRPTGGALGDSRVRTAVAAALDRPSLIATGVGSGPSADLVADSQLLAPSQPGYRPTAPATGPPVQPDPETVDRLLTDAGYTRGADGWERSGTALRLVVAAPVDRASYEVLAARVADQLRDAGIEVELRLVESDELFGEVLRTGGQRERLVPRRQALTPSTDGVDIAVVPQPIAADPAAAVVSWFGCPLVVPARLEPAPPNPAGFCDITLQPMMESALVGTDPLTEAVDRALWERAVTIPLYQQASLLVTTDELRGVSPGSPWEGPFHGAGGWQLHQVDS